MVAATSTDHARKPFIMICNGVNAADLDGNRDIEQDRIHKN